MAGGKEKGPKIAKVEPVAKVAVVTVEPEPKPEVSNLCDTCLRTYPHCDGDQAEGFKTENGIIIGCSKHQTAVETELEPEPEPRPSQISKPKPIPKRLKEKRKIQAGRLAVS